MISVRVLGLRTLTYTVAVLASALDPRFKALNFLSARQGQQVATNVIKLCEEKAEGTEQSEASSTGATGAPPTKKKKPPPPAEPTSIDSLFGPEDKFDTSIPTEVKRYFADPAVSRNEDPLLWWRKNESRFPHIARLARLFLAVPATSTPSERVFSAAGNIVTKKRSALSPENVDALIFLNKNWSLLFQLPSTPSSSGDPSSVVKVEEQEEAEPELPDLL